jgi:tRNA-splicing ligase RtcB
VRDYQITLPDRQLVCAPASSPEGKDYFAAMAAAANFAWANRQVLMHRVRQALDDALRGTHSEREFRLLYDVTHNIVKRESYPIAGVMTELLVHRKGATRAFGPGRPEIPAPFRATGQPVLVPGDMGTASYILVGTQVAMDESFGSCCHGAGRAMSRTEASKTVGGKELQARLRQRGIIVRAGSWDGLAEEAPEAYKDINRVVDAVQCSGIARKVARTIPLGVIKG